jgi:general secretion pathway protein C
VELVDKFVALRSRPPAQWMADANRVLPTVAAWLLVVAIAWHAAHLLWAILPGEPEFDWTQPPQPAAAPVSLSMPQVDFRAVADAHLFGEAGKEPEPVATTTAAPDTRMNLKLKGTIAADDETLAHAIITDSSGKSKVYFVEDAMAGGTTLHEVYVDRVILKRGAVLETLRLPKLSQNLGASVNTTIGADSNASSRADGNGSIRDMVESRPAAFTEIVRPQPYMPNGQLKGYRVYPGRDRRTFAALGLRPGDLVTDINGQPLDNIQSGMEIFRDLGDATQVTVTIERNGSSMVLTLDQGQFDNAAGANR